MVAVGCARGRAQWVVKGQCQNVSKYFVALRLPRGPVQPSVKQSAPPFPFLFPALVREWTGSSVHSSVQLGENKWFNKRLEVCNHLNFTSFVLFMISVHNFLTVHPPPPTTSLSLCCSHSLSPNYRTKQNYFDLYARRAAKAKATVPWRSSSSTCPS